MDDIQRHYQLARQAAFVQLESRARKILQQHKSLDEFVVGMGTAFFTDRQGHSISPHERRYMQGVESLLVAWDAVFHLTGNPMRFTADGPKITDW